MNPLTCIKTNIVLNLLQRFVKRHLHGGPPEPVDIDTLKQQIQELQQRNLQLEDEVSQLKSQVWNH